MNEDLLLKIYNKYNLSEKGSFEQFKQDMNDPGIRAKFHQKYLSDKGSLDQFEGDLGVTPSVTSIRKKGQSVSTSDLKLIEDGAQADFELAKSDRDNKRKEILKSSTKPVQVMQSFGTDEQFAENTLPELRLKQLEKLGLTAEDLSPDQLYDIMYPGKAKTKQRNADLVETQFEKQRTSGGKFNVEDFNDTILETIGSLGLANILDELSPNMTVEEIMNAKPGDIPGFENPERLLRLKQYVSQGQMERTTLELEKLANYRKYAGSTEGIPDQAFEAIKTLNDFQRRQSKQITTQSDYDKAIAAQNYLKTLPDDVIKRIDSREKVLSDVNAEIENVQKKYPNAIKVLEIDRELQEAKDKNWENKGLALKTLTEIGATIGEFPERLYHGLNSTAELVGSKFGNDGAMANMVREAGELVQRGTFRDASVQRRQIWERTADLNYKGQNYIIGYNEDGSIKEIYNSFGNPARIDNKTWNKIAKEAQTQNKFQESKEKLNWSSAWNAVTDGASDLLGTMALAYATGGLGAALPEGTAAARLLAGSGPVASRVREFLPVMFQYSGRLAAEGIRLGLTPEQASTYGISQGLVEGFTEALFPIIGKATGRIPMIKDRNIESMIKAVGAKNPNEMLAKMSKKAFWKDIAVAMGAEGSEEGLAEILSPLMNGALNTVMGTELDSDLPGIRDIATATAIGAAISVIPGVLGSVRQSKYLKDQNGFMRDTIVSVVKLGPQASEIARRMGESLNNQDYIDVADKIDAVYGQLEQTINDNNITDKQKASAITKAWNAITSQTNDPAITPEVLANDDHNPLTQLISEAERIAKTREEIRNDSLENPEVITPVQVEPVDDAEKDSTLPPEETTIPGEPDFATKSLTGGRDMLKGRQVNYQGVEGTLTQDFNTGDWYVVDNKGERVLVESGNSEATNNEIGLSFLSQGAYKPRKQRTVKSNLETNEIDIDGQIYKYEKTYDTPQGRTVALRNSKGKRVFVRDPNVVHQILLDKIKFETNFNGTTDEQLAEAVAEVLPAKKRGRPSTRPQPTEPTSDTGVFEEEQEPDARSEFRANRSELRDVENELVTYYDLVDEALKNNPVPFVESINQFLDGIPNIGTEVSNLRGAAQRSKLAKLFGELTTNTRFNDKLKTLLGADTIAAIRLLEKRRKQLAKKTSPTELKKKIFAENKIIAEQVAEERRKKEDALRKRLGYPTEAKEEQAKVEEPKPVSPPIPKKLKPANNLQSLKSGEVVRGTILDKGNDLLGDEKEPWMLTKDQFMVGGLPETRQVRESSHRRAVQSAVIDGDYLKAIKEGRMTAKDAETIIKSAGVTIPPKIQDKIDQQNAQLKSTPKEVRTSNDEVREMIDAAVIQPAPKSMPVEDLISDAVSEGVNEGVSDAVNLLTTSSDTIVSELNKLKTKEEKLKWLADNGLLQPITLNGKTVNAIDYHDRVMVLIKIGNLNVPFYISTGKAGKKNVQSGKWYAVFGIGQDGWINKGTQDLINDQYGYPILKKIAKILNDGVGHITLHQDDGRIQNGYQYLVDENIDAFNSQLNFPSKPTSHKDGFDATMTHIANVLTEINNQTANLEALNSANVVASNKEDTLTKLRSELDQLNQNLVGAIIAGKPYDDLIAERNSIVAKIGDYKRANNLPIEDKGREEVVIKNVREIATRLNGDPQKVEDAFRKIIADSKAFQEKLVNRSAETQGFFSEVVTGDEKHRPKKAWKAILKFTELEDKFKLVYDKFKGFFDNHIATSIPTFRETQIKVGRAIVGTFEDRKDPLVYDIGGSEGGFVKAITESSNGKIKSINLDPNPDMAKVFKQTPVEGSEVVEEAFYEGFDDVKKHTPEKKADVVHESMTFQFITTARDSFVKEVKDNYLKPDGLFLTEEKLIPDTEQEWIDNEKVKDEYKSEYYENAQIAKKNEEILVGMKKNQTKRSDYIRVLQENFEHVVEYWVAGNFRGFAASNDKATIDKFMSELGGQVKWSKTITPKGSALGKAMKLKKIEQANKVRDGQQAVTKTPSGQINEVRVISAGEKTSLVQNEEKKIYAEDNVNIHNTKEEAEATPPPKVRVEKAKKVEENIQAYFPGEDVAATVKGKSTTPLKGFEDKINIGDTVTNKKGAKFVVTGFKHSRNTQEPDNIIIANNAEGYVVETAYPLDSPIVQEIIAMNAPAEKTETVEETPVAETTQEVIEEVVNVVEEIVPVEDVKVGDIVIYQGNQYKVKKIEKNTVNLTGVNVRGIHGGVPVSDLEGKVTQVKEKLRERIKDAFLRSGGNVSYLSKFISDNIARIERFYGNGVNTAPVKEALKLVENNPSEENINNLIQKYESVYATARRKELNKMNNINPRDVIHRTKLSDVLKNIKPTLGVGQKLVLEMLRSLNVEVVVLPDSYFFSAAGRYNHGDGKIYLPESFNESDLIHEAIHALVTDMYLNDPGFKREFDEMFNALKSGLKKSKFVNNPSLIDDIYGFSDPEEFLTELFSDSKFANTFGRLPATVYNKNYTNISILDSIINFFVRFFQTGKLFPRDISEYWAYRLRRNEGQIKSYINLSFEKRAGLLNAGKKGIEFYDSKVKEDLTKVILYHGTKADIRAEDILPGKQTGKSYRTHEGIYVTPSLEIAKKYAFYGEGGVVLRFTLSDDSKVLDLTDPIILKEWLRENKVKPGEKDGMILKALELGFDAIIIEDLTGTAHSTYIVGNPNVLIPAKPGSELYESQSRLEREFFDDSIRNNEEVTPEENNIINPGPALTIEKYNKDVVLEAIYNLVNNGTYERNPSKIYEELGPELEKVNITLSDIQALFAEPLTIAVPESYVESDPARPMSDHLKLFTSPDTIADALNQKGFAILTATVGAWGPHDNNVNTNANNQLKIELESEFGQENVLEVFGMYKGEPDGRSFIVTNIKENRAIEIGTEKFQESIYLPKGLFFTRGEKEGKYHPRTGVTLIGDSAKNQDFYSIVGQNTVEEYYFADIVDFDTLRDKNYKAPKPEPDPNVAEETAAPKSFQAKNSVMDDVRSNLLTRKQPGWIGKGKYNFKQIIEEAVSRWISLDGKLNTEKDIAMRALSGLSISPPEVLAMAYAVLRLNRLWETQSEEWLKAQQTGDPKEATLWGTLAQTESLIARFTDAIKRAGTTASHELLVRQEILNEDLYTGTEGFAFLKGKIYKDINVQMFSEAEQKEIKKLQRDLYKQRLEVQRLKAELRKKGYDAKKSVFESKIEEIKEKEEKIKVKMAKNLNDAIDQLDQLLAAEKIC